MNLSQEASNIELPWDEKKWWINTHVVQIEGNTFDFVGDYGFYGIGPPFSNINHEIFSFSKNIIRVMQSKALQFWFRKYNPSDNWIPCDCGSIGWFYDTAFGRDPTYNSWFNSKNRNRCLNTPNCPLNKINFNFYDLCLEDYQCAVDFHNKLFKGSKFLGRFLKAEK